MLQTGLNEGTGGFYGVRTFLFATYLGVIIMKIINFNLGYVLMGLCGTLALYFEALWWVLIPASILSLILWIDDIRKFKQKIKKK